MTGSDSILVSKVGMTNRPLAGIGYSFGSTAWAGRQIFSAFKTERRFARRIAGKPAMLGLEDDYTPKNNSAAAGLSIWLR